MKRILCAFAILAFAMIVVSAPASADGILKKHHGRPACEPGFKIVEEVVIQEVTRALCKFVPETKKKWVYTWVDDPFCIQDRRHPHDCPHCAGPYCRKLLVKRQIDEPCQTLKCVTELITERIPVKVYRKVPCDLPPGK
jgi:hypothetical protein